MFIFGIFLSALSVGAWVSSIKTAEMNMHTKMLEIDDVMLSVTEKINTVWVEGEGFSSNLTVPGLVASSYYTINVTSNFVLMNISGELYIKPIITENITGTLEKGAVNTLTNRGDHIEIS
jgi:hypothetical protein